MLRRSPGLAAAAILSIGLGIGATTAIFGVVRHVLLRPLPFAAAERLVALWETSPYNPERWVAPANYLDWQRDAADAFEAMAAYDSFSAAVSGDGEPERLRAALGPRARSSRFSASARPKAARSPLPTTAPARRASPCSPARCASVAFGGNPAVGAVLALDGRPCEVVGVLPEDFTFPLQSRAEVSINGDRGVPRSFPFPGDITTVRDSHLLYVVGRLRPGVSVGAAQAVLQTVMARAGRRPSRHQHRARRQRRALARGGGR